MPACSVLFCGNRTEKGIRLFSLPLGARNEERRNIWIKNINRKNLPPSTFVCEEHFEEDQFENNRQDGRRPLKASAIPTIFGAKKCFQTNHSNIDDSQQDKPLIASRKSTRKRTIKFKLQSEEEEEEEEEEYEPGKTPLYPRKVFKKNCFKIIDGVKCRACLKIFNKCDGHILKKILDGKTLIETIITFIPQLELTLSTSDYICHKCCKLLLNFNKFVESCIETDEKLKNGLISLEVEEDDEVKKEQETSVNIEGFYNDLQDIQNTTQKIERKRKQDLVNHHQHDTEGKTEEKHDIQIFEPPVRRKRGRPRKNPILADKTFDIYKSKDFSPTNKEYKDEVLIKDKTSIDLSTEEKENGEQFESTEETLEDFTVQNLTDHDYVTEVGEKEKLFQCPNCILDYRTASGLKSHLKYTHKIEEDQEFECRLCSMKFIRFKDMLKHKNTHGFPCNLCEEIFPTSESLTSHKHIHPEKYCCMKCGMKFQKEEVLTKHSSLHDAMTKAIIGSRKPLNCNLCEMSFTINSSLKEHIKNVHMKIKNIPCLDCDKKFGTSNSLRLHRRLKHTKRKPFKCDRCNTYFARKDHLENHKLIHNTFHNPNRRTYSRTPTKTDIEYECPFCSKIASNRQILINHIVVHTVDRNFECRYCGLKLSSCRTKYAHEKAHESDPNSKFICMTCWKRFSNEEELKEHEVKHSPDVKRFGCCLCGAIFARKIILENHVLEVHATIGDLDISSADKNNGLDKEVDLKEENFIHTKTDTKLPKEEEEAEEEDTPKEEEAEEEDTPKEEEEAEEEDTFEENQQNNGDTIIILDEVYLIEKIEEL